MKVNEKIKWGEFPEFFGPRDYFRNTIIIKKIQNFVKKKGTILDFGCGVGNLSIRLAMLNYLVFSYDISSLCLKVLNEKTKGKKLKIKIIKNNELSKFKEYFDCICCGEVLEHIKEEDSVLKLFWNILKKNGLCIITVPAKMKYWDIVDEMSTHFRRYEKKEIIDLLKKNGFKLKIFYCFGPVTFFWHKFIFIPVLKRKMLNKRKNRSFFNNFFKIEFLKKMLSYLFYFDFLFLSSDIWNSYLIVAKKNEKQNS